VISGSPEMGFSAEERRGGAEEAQRREGKESRGTRFLQKAGSPGPSPAKTLKWLAVA